MPHDQASAIHRCCLPSTAPIVFATLLNHQGDATAPVPKVAA